MAQVLKGMKEWDLSDVQMIKHIYKVLSFLKTYIFKLGESFELNDV